MIRSLIELLIINLNIVRFYSDQSIATNIWTHPVNIVSKLHSIHFTYWCDHSMDRRFKVPCFIQYIDELVVRNLQFLLLIFKFYVKQRWWDVLLTVQKYIFKSAIVYLHFQVIFVSTDFEPIFSLNISSWHFH